MNGCGDVPEAFIDRSPLLVLTRQSKLYNRLSARMRPLLDGRSLLRNLPSK